MSHELTIKANGQAEMAYVGEEPWHGLGQKLEPDASIEVWKKAAGMDWDIKRSRVRYGDKEMFEKYHVLFRSDTKEPLSIVSESYNITQPGEVLDFFHDLTESSGFSLETAGTLFGGKQFWALAKIGEEAVIAGDDKIDGYLLLATSCDGTVKTTGKFVAERVVCRNTLSMAMAEKGRSVVKKSHRSIFDPAEMKDQLGIARDTWGEFLKHTRRLSKIGVPNQKASEFIAKLLLDTNTVSAKDPLKTVPHRKIMELFQNSAMGGTLTSAEGSAWGLVNAVTEFVDHHAKNKTPSHRMASAWFGRGDVLKTAAFDLAETL